MAATRARVQMRKPVVRYDYGKGYATINLPPLAVEKMRDRGLDTRKMEQELRGYLRHRGIEEARPVRVVQIVSRYVDVLPISMDEMVRVLGLRAARRSLPEGLVPQSTWLAQDYLDAQMPTARPGARHREEVYRHIEMLLGGPVTFEAITTRHLRAQGLTRLDVTRYWMRVDRERLINGRT